MYDIDRALRRLELAHRIEELDKHRTRVPGPTPVPEVSAPMDVVDPDATHLDAEVEPSAPRTLPNGLPLRTPGTKFRTQPAREPSTIVVPLGTPLMPTTRPETLRSRLVTGWAADHDAASRRGAFTPLRDLTGATPPAREPGVHDVVTDPPAEANPTAEVPDGSDDRDATAAERIAAMLRDGRPGMLA